MSGYSDVVLLDFVNNSAGASAQLNSKTFDPFNFLTVDVFIVNYSATSTARLQFNGDAGTTAYSYSVMEGASAPTTAVAATAAGWAVATTNQVPRALITFRIQNFNGQSKGGVWTGSSGSTSASTAPAIVQGSGVWANNAQIIRVTLDVGPGGGTLNAGSQMWVWGHRA